MIAVIWYAGEEMIDLIQSEFPDADIRPALGKGGLELRAAALTERGVKLEWRAPSVLDGLSGFSTQLVKISPGNLGDFEYLGKPTNPEPEDYRSPRFKAPNGAKSSSLQLSPTGIAKVEILELVEKGDKSYWRIRVKLQTGTKFQLWGGSLQAVETIEEDLLKDIVKVSCEEPLF